MKARNLLATRAPFAVLAIALTALPAAAAEEAIGRAGWQTFSAGAAKPVVRSVEPSPSDAARPRAPMMHLVPGGACGASEFEVCLDTNGRLSIPGAKRFMPALPGLQAERVTVKKGGISLGYSF
jgi:hypothetical protein